MRACAHVRTCVQHSACVHHKHGVCMLCIHAYVVCVYCKYIHDPCVHSMSGFMTSTVNKECRLTLHWCITSNLEESSLDVTHY